jgi:hypothetical protein
MSTSTIVAETMKSLVEQQQQQAQAQAQLQGAK